MIRCGGNGIVNFNIGNGSLHEINTPVNSVQLNQWHHVAATYDGNTMKIYIDGELAVQSSASFTIGNANNSNLLVGDSPGFPGRVFNGKIDEVRIWNIARTQYQIQNTMHTILSPEYYSTSDSGLVGYWQLDEGTGQNAEDLSFYSNNATLGTTINPETNDPIWVSANILIVNIDDENKDVLAPTRFYLSQNYPNPFNPSTKINFSLPHKSSVTIKIYDVLGNEVATLVNEEKPAGSYQVIFDASNLSSGIYFYKLTTEESSQAKKLVLIK